MADQVLTKDPTSQSNYTQIATTHVSFDWTVDFEKRCIHGSATHRLVAKEDVSEVMYVYLAATLTGSELERQCAVHSFDTRVLEIETVEVNGHVVEVRLPMLLTDSMHDQCTDRRTWIPNIPSWGLRSMFHSH